MNVADATLQLSRRCLVWELPLDETKPGKRPLSVQPSELLRTWGRNTKCRLSQNYFFWVKPKRRVNLRKYRESLAKPRVIIAIVARL